jgi:hypothetical protein
MIVTINLLLFYGIYRISLNNYIRKNKKNNVIDIFRNSNAEELIEYSSLLIEFLNLKNGRNFDEVIRFYSNKFNKFKYDKSEALNNINYSYLNLMLIYEYLMINLIELGANEELYVSFRNEGKYVFFRMKVKIDNIKYRKFEKAVIKNSVFRRYKENMMFAERAKITNKYGGKEFRFIVKLPLEG